MQHTSPRTRNFWNLLFVAAPLLFAGPASAVEVGVLQATPERAPQMRAAGLTIAHVGVVWRRFEPQQGQIDTTYVAEMQGKLAKFKAAGQGVVLDFGMQYPPAWAFEIPHSRYINQFGQAYLDQSPGKNVLNSVFNQQVRTAQSNYVANVFRELGTDFKAVRLGWGWYGELHFPKNKFSDRDNCYWGFDEIAQGKAPGLPSGIPPCPVNGWKPGEPSPGHISARTFVEWYFNAMKNYHDWQIQTVSQHYKGYMTMMYPSWGLRRGHANAAIQGDLSGKTQPEKGGDMAEAVDYARFVSGITNPNVVIQTTWLDARWGNDAQPDPGDWTPGKYLRHLVDQHPIKLQMSGENTGNADQAALDRTLQRAKDLRLIMVLWAFEPQLFDARFVSFETFKQGMQQHLLDEG